MKTLLFLTSLVAFALLSGCERTEKTVSQKQAHAWLKSVTEGPSTPESRKKAQEWLKKVLAENRDH